MSGENMSKIVVKNGRLVKQQAGVVDAATMTTWLDFA